MIDTKKPYVTPKGIAVFPYLNTPDTFAGQSKYKCDLRISPEEAQHMISKFQPMLDDYAASQGVANLNPLPIKEELIQGEATGSWLVRTSMNSSFKNRQGQVVEMRPKVVDASGTRRVPSSVLIGGGSELRISFTLFPYKMTEAVVEGGKKTKRDVCGLSFRLNGVQLLKLQEPGEAGGLGFDEDPGGYQAPTSEFVDAADY
jgi:hypothetical protein